jgi:hypothetical protein
MAYMTAKVQIWDTTFLYSVRELCKGDVLPLERGLLMKVLPICQFIPI